MRVEGSGGEGEEGGETKMKQGVVVQVGLVWRGDNTREFGWEGGTGGKVERNSSSRRREDYMETRQRERSSGGFGAAGKEERKEGLLIVLDAQSLLVVQSLPKLFKKY